MNGPENSKGKENQGVGVAIAAPTPRLLCPFFTQLEVSVKPDNDLSIGLQRIATSVFSACGTEVTAS